MLGHVQAEEPGVQPGQSGMYGESSRQERSYKAKREKMRARG